MNTLYSSGCSLWAASLRYSPNFEATRRAYIHSWQVLLICFKANLLLAEANTLVVVGICMAYSVDYSLVVVVLVVVVL
jgi:hypothetical protein